MRRLVRANELGESVDDIRPARRGKHLIVSDMLTTKLVTVFPDDTLSHAAGLLRQHQFHHLPVTSMPGEHARSRTRLLFEGNWAWCTQQPTSPQCNAWATQQRLRRLGTKARSLRALKTWRSAMALARKTHQSGLACMNPWRVSQVVHSWLWARW